MKKNIPTVIRSLDDIPYMVSARHMQHMGLSRNAVYAMFNRSDFPAIQYGNRRYIRKDRLLDWLDSHAGAKL
ncbi:MAG: helix-turn-helix domain-containing protein [Clostridiales bacterium]|nr:helix-turn-helix domain-containing protein [Clostridiales bacterium]